MALILKNVHRFYFYFNDELSDPRTQDWFLMRSPWLGLAFLGLYLYLIFDYLPKYMSNRLPYDLRAIIGVYNAVQIIACTYIVYQSIRLGWGRHYSLICQGVDFSDSPLAIEYAWKVCYGYFAMKFVDLLDTIFFILRKKQNHVSFLHVYHHTGMVILSWALVKWLPGGHGTILVLVNSFVHMIMYAYYLLTIVDESYKHSIWLKRNVTHLQLLQFTVLNCYFIPVLVWTECDYPQFTAYIFLPQNTFMLILFGDFYYKAYIKKSSSKKP